MKRFILFSLILSVISCAPIYVNYDYEKGTDFRKYKTYNYYSDMKTGLSELDTKRLLDALDLKMQEKGFVLSDTPDFFIDIKSSEFQEAQRQTVGVGLGGGGRNVGGGISIGLPLGQANVNREITIDLVGNNGKLIRILYDDKGKKGENRLIFTTENLASGIYFLRIYSEKEVLLTKKLVRR